MNPVVRFEDNHETVVFDAEIHGHPVRIEGDRETIEDHVSAETLAAEERLDFVRRNRQQIIENVADYTQSATDLDGIRITGDQLKRCH